MENIITFFQSQTKLELLFMTYFLTLLVYMAVVFFIKHRHRRNLLKFLLKYKDALCGITYLILAAYMVVGCLVIKVVENLIVYLGCMLMAAIVVNFLYILGYGIKKYKDIEFDSVNITEAYSETVKTIEMNDLISEWMSEFVSYMSVVDDDENEENISSLSFRDFTCTWLSYIHKYLDTRMKMIDYLELIQDKEILFNYVKQAATKLWYKDEDFTEFVEMLVRGQEVVLTDNSRLIPIISKRYACLLHVVGNEVVTDTDRAFLINTYSIMSLL